MRQVVHLAVIMDGNRRWAKKEGLPFFMGHRQGGEKIKEVINWSAERGIKILTLYALSIENLQRPKREVDFLLNLAEKFIERNTPELKEKGARVQVLGLRKGLPPSLVEKIASIESATRENERIIVNILFNYSGRVEIVEAVKRIINADFSPVLVNEAVIERFLWTNGLPDPDLVIRTSGEMRLSNFLTWQTAYSEWYFCKKYWPDFSEKDLDTALEDFDRRQRNFGR